MQDRYHRMHGMWMTQRFVTSWVRFGKWIGKGDDGDKGPDRWKQCWNLWELADSEATPGRPDIESAELQELPNPRSRRATCWQGTPCDFMYV